MKIDFDRLEVFTDLERRHCTVAKLRRPLANALYTLGSGISCHALALKLWNTAGAQDFSGEEAALIRSLAERACSPAVIEAVRAATEERKEAGDGDGD